MAKREYTTIITHQQEGRDDWHQKIVHHILGHLLQRYKRHDVEGGVYKLFYHGGYLVMKSKTISGALMRLSQNYNYFDTRRKKTDPYSEFYNHIHEHPGGRFRVKILAEGSTCTNYELLKIEQMELDKGRYDGRCLNGSMDAYIPKFDPSTGMHGWLSKTAVDDFKVWLASEERKDLLQKYSR
jgi:hypothetical protein